MKRIVQGTPVNEILKTLRESQGYYITNTARDQSQSDFKNRIYAQKAGGPFPQA